MAEQSLYERLGGVFAIAAVIDHFSDAVVKNASRDRDPEPGPSRVAHAQLGRLPGLKFMRTLWVCDVAGGPFDTSARSRDMTRSRLEEAHRRRDRARGVRCGRR